MNRDHLRAAILAKAREIDADSDTKELLCVLSRVVLGKPVAVAFGAPGDWGYGTPIGDALAAKPDLPQRPPDFICRGGEEEDGK
jgi:hypothetical protein